MKFHNIKGLLDFRHAERESEGASKRRERRSIWSFGASGLEESQDEAPKSRSQVMQLMDELDRLKSELGNANERVNELEAIADEDPLVPVLNRRGFMRELERVLAYVTRYKTRVSLVYCDLDDFKAVNDAHGHAAGDLALQFFAKFLVDSVRRSDLVGRMGGDEFALALHHADKAGALEKALRLARNLASQPIDYDGQKISLSMSVGVTELRTDDTVSEVLERADRAMYAFKKLNKIKSASGAVPAN